MIYVWDIADMVAVTMSKKQNNVMSGGVVQTSGGWMSGDSSVAGKSVAPGANQIIECPLLGVVELPVKLNYAVNLLSCGDSAYLSRILVLADDGTTVIVEMETTGARIACGDWRVSKV